MRTNKKNLIKYIFNIIIALNLLYLSVFCTHIWKVMIVLAALSIPIPFFIKDKPILKKIKKIVMFSFFFFPTVVYFLTPEIDKKAYVYLFQFLIEIFKFLKWLFVSLL